MTGAIDSDDRLQYCCHARRPQEIQGSCEKRAANSFGARGLPVPFVFRSL